MSERDPLIDNPTPLEILADLWDCRKVLREQGDPHTWLDAWQLHRARIAAHKLIRTLKRTKGKTA
jgi:hypothetical protein